MYHKPKNSEHNDAIIMNELREIYKVFPYLLRGLKINRPNQVWQVDITYIKRCYFLNGYIPTKQELFASFVLSPCHQMEVSMF